MKKVEPDMPRKINLEHSRPLDVYIWSDKPAIKRIAKKIYSLMETECQAFTKENKRKRKKITLIPYGNRPLKGHRVLDKLRAILTDLYIAAKQDINLFLAFSRSADAYRENKRNPKIFLGLRYVMFVTDFLEAKGYIELHKGVYSREGPEFSRLSRMKATRKLRKFFKYYDAKSNETGHFLRRTLPIMLRDAKGRDMEFQISHPQAKSYLKNVNRINRLLKRHTIEISESVFKDDPEGMLDYKTHACSQNTKYYRVFNNGDMALRTGGRFYGHWSQQIKSKYRKYIQIDGKNTVEADYKCLHISILYSYVTKSIPEGDLYELPGIPKEYRPLIKKAVNISLNASNELQALRALALESFKFYKENPNLQRLRCRTIIDAITEKHAPIKKYFHTGYGLRLQFFDSCIAEEIMLAFCEDDIPVLCIHDSFIIAEQHKEKLKEVMEQKYINNLRCTPIIEFKESVGDDNRRNAAILDSLVSYNLDEVRVLDYSLFKEPEDEFPELQECDINELENFNPYDELNKFTEDEDKDEE